MNEENLIKYYNKFNEDKRLTHRHGIVEFITAKKYIDKYINKDSKIIDIGAGTGKYSITLYNEGYDITAIELVKHNLMTLKKNCPDLKSYQGNALNLTKEQDNTYDLVLLFGPLYHLISFEEKVKALQEAKRILKPNGIIMISYYMNEYAIIKHGFMENKILEAKANNEFDSTYHITPKETDLYSMVRLEDIDLLNKTVGLKRIEIISQDGPSDYLRPIINKMDDETFNEYINYHLITCTRPELLGASSHVLDIVTK